MRLIKPLFGLCLPLLLQGCATLNKEECLHSDWRLIGFEDGSKGLPQNRIGEHRSACAEYGVTPNLTDYQMGWQQGIVEFCKPQQGYQHGLSGNSYHGVCPQDLEAGFLSGFYYGQKIYQAESHLRQLERDFRQIEKEQNNLQNNINQKQGLLISDQSTPELRLKLLNEIKASTERQGEINSELSQLASEKGRLEMHIHQLKTQSPYF